MDENELSAGGELELDLDAGAEEFTPEDAPENEVRDERYEQDGAPEQESQDDDPEEEIEVGGEKLKVKKSELRAGYMKDADYRQKTAKVAEQQRAVEAFAAQMQQERQTAANQLDVYLQSLHQELIGAQPNPALIDSDPQEFMRQQAQYHARAQHFQRAQAERQALQQRMGAEQQQRGALHLQGERERLMAAMPEWRNAKVRDEETKQIKDYLGTIGFSPDEIGTVADHRALLLARDAMRYRAMQAMKSKQTPPEPRKPVRPGVAGSSAANSTVQRARERLGRNSSDEAALVGLLGASGF